MVFSLGNIPGVENYSIPFITINDWYLLRRIVFCPDKARAPKTNKSKTACLFIEFPLW
jgi:hypothetical protein